MFFDGFHQIWLFAMANWRMFFAFYTSTVIICYAVSCTVALVALFLVRAPFFVTFSISIATVGLFMSLLYKEISHPEQYYFYYNRGISKMRLYAFCGIINVVIGTLILIFYAQST